MPAHVDLQLLSKLITTGDMKSLMEEGITIDTFCNPDARMAFELILRYYQDRDTRNIIPNWDWIDKNCVSIDFPPNDDRYTIQALCKEVKKNWVSRRLEQVLADAGDCYEKEPLETLKELAQTCKELSISVNKSDDIVLAETVDDIRRQYLQAKNATGYLGIPYPMGWGYHTEGGKPKMIKKTGRQDHPLNEQTRGKQAGEFILFYGRPKSMKTWLLIDMAVEDYNYNHCRTLFLTKEMRPEQIRTRFVARMIGADYTAFKNGDLPKEQEEDFFDMLDYIKDEEDRFKKDGKKSSLLITTGWDGDGGIDGVASLEAKIDAFEPDVTYVDSVYLMKVLTKGNKQSWERIAALSEGLKSLAVRKKIPIIASSQANRRGEETKGSNLSEIAFGDSLGQSCDLAIRVIQREAEDGNVKLACVVSGGREIKLPGFLLQAEPAVKFQLEQVFESSRQIQAQFRAEEESIAREEDAARRKVEKENKIAQAKKSWDK